MNRPLAEIQQFGFHALFMKRIFKLLKRRICAAFFAAARDAFDFERFEDLTRRLKLDPARPIRTFSKGMKKQLAVILGLSTGAKYLLCDETFDGLDPVMRQAVTDSPAAARWISCQRKYRCSGLGGWVY